MDMLQRFLSYVAIDTQSDHYAPEDRCPSTEKQKDLGVVLVEELQGMGLSDAHMNEHGYVYATLKANCDTVAPTIGLIAHMDTSPDCSGKNVKARVIENYDGKAIVLSEGIVSDPEVMTELKGVVGHDIVVTDGTTLLGADNKAGIAIITEVLRTLVSDDSIKHGEIKVAFTPDEEVGRGTANFDVEAFGADFAFTIDGGTEGEIQYESFNACDASIKIRGRSVHPGSAKNKMLNALNVAQELHALLPVSERPEHTERREGFYHLTELSGSCEAASMKYIIRDHDKGLFNSRKATVEACVRFINERYGEDTATLALKDSYYNMAEVLEERRDIIELATGAMAKLGIEPIIEPIRGGTDGSGLSFMGLPCPNLFTGGYCFHGPHEFLSVNEMKNAVKTVTLMLTELVKRAE